ncbi:MAG: thioesterase family protein [Candidatus Omnitrophota bacterium]
MAKKNFSINIRVYLRDTNLFGNVYFANYFYWQGVAREEFFRQVTPDPMFFINKKIKMVTIEASMKFKKEALLFDDIEIKVEVKNPKITTFELIFTFVNKVTNEIHGEGRQKIGFVGQNGSVIPIPPEIAIRGVQYI